MAISNITDVLESINNGIRAIYANEEVPTTSITDAFPIDVMGGAETIITPAVFIRFINSTLDLKVFKQYITIELFFIHNKAPDSLMKSIALYDKFCQSTQLRGIKDAYWLAFSGYSYSAVKYEDGIFNGISTQITFLIKQSR